MKKILLFLLLSVAGYGQTSTGQEQEFDYGIKNNSTQTITTPPYLGTFGTDGTQGKIPSAYIAKTAAVQDSLNKKLNLPTGFLQGLALSINADPAKFNIAAGYYVVTDFTNLAQPVVKIISYPGATGLTPTYLASANSTYVALDINQNVISSASPFTDAQRRTLAIIGNVVHSNHTTINVTNEIKAPIVAIGNQLHDFMKAIGFLNESGNVYSPNGANLQLNKSAGDIFGMGINSANYLSPHKLTIPSQTALTFSYRFQNGVQIAGTTNINPNIYDVGGVSTATPSNKWTIQRINLFQSGITVAQPGQTVYNSFNDAVSALPTQSFVTEQNIADNAVFRCYLIVQQGTTNLTSAVAGGTAQFVPVDKFGNVIGNGSVALTYSNIVAALGFTPENVANKATDFSVVDNTKYPTAQAVKTQLDLKQNYPQDALIVAKLGGQYTTVQSAVDASTGTAIQPQVIIIYPGIYLEKVNTVGKFVSLIGVDKKACIIKTDTGNYTNPPLECSGGLYAENLTFLATSESPDVHTLYSYAVHMDFYGSGKTEFFNCIFESQQNSALGIGLHQDQTLILSSCDIVKKSNGHVYDEGGALYFHNSPNPETGQKLIVKNSKIVADQGYALRIDDARLNAGGTDTTTTVEFINNNFLSIVSGSGSNIYFAGNAPVNGGISGNIKLTTNSYYNNIQILNTTSIDVTSFRGIKFPAFGSGSNAFSMFNNSSDTGDLQLLRADNSNILWYKDDKTLQLGSGAVFSDLGDLSLKSIVSLNDISVTGSNKGIIFDNPLSQSGGITHKSSGTNVWNINKGGGDATENYNIYNFGRGAIDLSLNNSTGVLKLLSLAGTGTRQVVADTSGNLSATDIATTSGTYTPTLTNTTNVTSSTLNAAYYVRNGNLVTVTIAVQLTLTATADTVFTFSLPVSGATVVNGIGQGNLTSGSGVVNAYGIVDTTNSTTAQLRIGSTAVAGSGAGVANIIFTYSL